MDSYRKYRKDYGSEQEVKYLEKLEKRIEINPYDIQACIEKGFLCLEVFELEVEEGFKVLIEALKNNSTHVDGLFWAASLAYLGIGNFWSAEDLLERALKIAPDRVDCLDLLAEILFSNGINYSERSLKLSKKAVELEPLWPTPRIHYLLSLINKKRLDEAEEVACEGIKLFKAFELPEGASRMEEYKEYMITGRTHYEKSHFNDLLEKIKKLRGEKS